ncbi:MAG: signal peptidase II, partial [Anaerolineae bacterium]|nr:signal peptidase II [Anaerolineae bacterium]
MRPVVRSRLLVVFIAVFVILFDQLLKLWITSHLREYVTISIFRWLDPVLLITPIRNTGGVFGLLPQLSQVFKYLSVLVIFVVIFYQRSIPPRAYWVHIALGFVSGGAVGNVIDRFTRGYVLDYFDANFWPFKNWPLFNLADSAIVFG